MNQKPPSEKLSVTMAVHAKKTVLWHFWPLSNRAEIKIQHFAQFRFSIFGRVKFSVFLIVF